jgi:glycogen debranching enzyme
MSRRERHVQHHTHDAPARDSDFAAFQQEVVLAEGECDLLRTARAKAFSVLRECATPAGFRASAVEPGYPQIWARDSMISGLGALATGDEELCQAFRASLVTLAAHRSELGHIPLNVEPESGTVSGENAAGVDANLWFVVGHGAYFRAAGDRSFLREHWPAIEAAVLWLRYQDVNNCGLLEIPEAGDWMDLFGCRYNVLYDNVLYCAALRVAAEMAGALEKSELQARYTTLAEDVHVKLNLLLWAERGWDPAEFADKMATLKRLHLEWYMVYHNIGTISSRPYYLPYVAFRDYGDYFDTLGNLLAILFGVADAERTRQILRFIRQVGGAHPFPAKAVHPPILPGDKDWREYYRSRNLNLPYQYHNGGIWPFVGGFYVATLVFAGRCDVARQQLHQLALANQQGLDEEWEFNEWLHGQTGLPMGYRRQAWSAAMYLFADAAVGHGRLPPLVALWEAPPGPTAGPQG